MSRSSQFALAAAVAGSCLASASAQTFQGRLANGAPSATCTVSGTTKCTMFFNPVLNITILNNWSIGFGSWSANGGAASAQALAASAGLAASGLTGWVLPTGNGFEVAGAQNQYLSIWNQVGSIFTGLNGQFAGVQSADTYWADTEYAPLPGNAWGFSPVLGLQNATGKSFFLDAVAVRPGDVASAVPEPRTYMLLLGGLGALLVVRRRRRRH
jgi:hypothetical protein